MEQIVLYLCISFTRALHAIICSSVMVRGPEKSVAHDERNESGFVNACFRTSLPSLPKMGARLFVPTHYRDLKNSKHPQLELSFNA